MPNGKKPRGKAKRMYTYAEYREKFLPKSTEAADRQNETVEDPYHTGKRLANKSLQQFGQMLVSG